MASINYRNDIQGLVEFRAACLWMRYWLASEGLPAQRRAAATVLADVAAWPSQRGQAGARRELAEQAAAGDAAAVSATVARYCSRELSSAASRPREPAPVQVADDVRRVAAGRQVEQQAGTAVAARRRLQQHVLDVAQALRARAP